MFFVTAGVVPCFGYLVFDEKSCFFLIHFDFFEVIRYAGPSIFSTGAPSSKHFFFSRVGGAFFFKKKKISSVFWSSGRLIKVYDLIGGEPIRFARGPTSPSTPTQQPPAVNALVNPFGKA